MSGGPAISVKKPDDEDSELQAGRKFNFPMKAGDLLEPTYFNRKNQSLTL